ncbi:MAG: hypothetical protein AB8B49_08470 [Nitratireductor sp.]
MIRSILRALALVSLALALVTAVLDLTKSIANSEWIFTSLQETLIQFSLISYEKTETFVSQYLGQFAWDVVQIGVLGAPSWWVFFVLWLVITLLTRTGHKKYIGEHYN